jgi:Amt family ammonium transporter
MQLKCRVDDPLESSAVHLGSGALGTLLLGFIARPEYVEALTGAQCGGAFYTGPHAGLQIGAQVLGMLYMRAALPVIDCSINRRS